MKLDMRKKQEKKETTKSTKKLPMTAKMKRAMAVYIVMVLIMTAGASTVFAGTGIPTSAHLCWFACTTDFQNDI